MILKKKFSITYCLYGHVKKRWNKMCLRFWLREQKPFSNMLQSYWQCNSDNQQLWGKEVRAKKTFEQELLLLVKRTKGKTWEKHKWRTTKPLKPSSAHTFPGITCRIYMVISQELISLMDPMGSSKKAHDISNTSLVYFIGFHTLNTKHKERKCISWNI